MKQYIINILLIISITACACSCCFMTSETLNKIVERQKSDISQDYQEEEIVDHGTFTGVPVNRKLSNISISGQAIDVDISGNYAYVTNDLGALYIIDISDKERPYVTGKCREIDSANIVIVKDDFAYVSYTEWIAGELGRGLLDQVYVRGANGYVILSAVGEEAVLTVLARKDAKLGLVFLDMRRAAEDLGRLI